MGKWCYENNELLPAYTYLYRAGEIEQILEYLNRPSNIRDELTDFVGFKEMFDSTPRELLYQYPSSYLQHIFLSLVKEDITNISEWKEGLNEFEEYYTNKGDMDEVDRNRILGEFLIVRKFTQFNHLEQKKPQTMK